MNPTICCIFIHNGSYNHLISEFYFPKVSAEMTSAFGKMFILNLLMLLAELAVEFIRFISLGVVVSAKELFRICKVYNHFNSLQHKDVNFIFSPLLKTNKPQFDSLAVRYRSKEKIGENSRVKSIDISYFATENFQLQTKEDYESK